MNRCYWGAFALTAALAMPMAQADALETLGCLVEPSKRVEISSPVAGVIERMAVERGEAVRKGALLFRLNSGVQEADYELKKAKYDYSSRIRERNQQLFQDELLSAHERDEIETEQHLAALDLAKAKEEFKQRSISSPFSGVVIDTAKDVGEYVGVEPVLVLARLQPLHVELLVSAEHFGFYRPGMRFGVKAKVQGAEQRVRSATVSVVDPLIDSASGTFRVRLLMDNKAHPIPAGVRCELVTPPA